MQTNNKYINQEDASNIPFMEEYAQRSTSTQENSSEKQQDGNSKIKG